MKISCYVLLCLAGSSAANAQQLRPSLRGDVGANNRLLQQKDQNMKVKDQNMKIDQVKDAAKNVEKDQKEMDKGKEKAMKFKEEKVDKVKALKGDIKAEKKPPAEKMMKEQPKKIATTRNPQCKNCSNTRPPPMAARGRTCETATDAIAWRCKGDPLWRKNTWCERTW